MMYPPALRLICSAGLVFLWLAGGVPAERAGAAEAIDLQSPPQVARDGGCTASDKTSFSATYERRGIFDDTTWAQDRYSEYLIDGGGKILDVRSRMAAVKTWQRSTATLATVASPASGPFSIVIYEEADSLRPHAIGSSPRLAAGLIRQQIEFDANALDADCPED